MEILVDRKWKKDKYTIGNVYINGIFFSNTMEDPDRGLTQKMTLEEIRKKKIYGETAIPSGEYDIKLTYSTKFASRAWGKKYSGKVPEITNVKGYSGVRIHPLNSAADSLGCIGFGKNDKVGWISNSTNYYYNFMDKYLLPALKKGERVKLTIK